MFKSVLLKMLTFVCCMYLLLSLNIVNCWQIETAIEHVNEIIENAESYDIVFPQVMENDGNRRKKRNVKDIHEKTEIVIKDWTVDTELNNDIFLKDGLESEWVNNDRISKIKLVDQDCVLHRGKIRGLNDSMVALTICGEIGDGEMMGLIQTTDGYYFIQPLDGGYSVNTHILFKAKGLKFKLGGDQDSDIGYSYKNKVNNTRNESSENWKENKYNDELTEMNEHIRSKRESYLNRNTTEIQLKISQITNDRDWLNRVIDGNGRLEPKGNASGEDIPEEELIRRQPLFDFENEEVGYFLDTVWVKDKTISRPRVVTHAPPRWLEIALAVDHSVITFHGSDRVQQYVLALMNIVSAIYKDPSLASNLKLVIVRMIFYEDKNSGEVREGNSKRSLENVNRWNDRLLSSLSRHERHDVAIWLTRIDLGGPSGYAPVSGACDPARSCALNRDEGLTSSFIIAHEVAHVLGLTHDGDQAAGNDCGGEAMLGSVMAPMVAATFHRFTWSTCSKREFHKKATSWHCLGNPPRSVNATHLKSTLQATFTMDEQCRMEFGEGYSLCRSFDLPEPCSHLWCGHFETPLVCKTKKGPPLEGTECGVDRWCVNGFCEVVDRRRFGLDPVMHNPRDGGWTSWGNWGTCSRPCGGGVSFKTRRCENPRPAYGGINCNGRSEEFRICNHVECPEPFRDFRAQQCARLPTLAPLMGSLGRRINQTWLPHEPDQENVKCQLICVSRETGEVFMTGENLLDGTSCSYDNENNICIQGDCQILGCDGILESTLKRDTCGVCGGNNSQCHTVSSLFNKNLRRATTRVAVLPRLARNIRIESTISLTNKMQLTTSKLVLRDRRRRFYNLTSPEDRNAPSRTELRRESDSAKATIVIEGARFHYERTGFKEILWANGPLLAELVVSIVAEESESGGVNVTVSSSYTLHAGRSKERYQWQVGGWGPCSKSCGGGKKTKTMACRDSQTSRLVAKRHCSLVVKPSTNYESCNTFSCDVTWEANEWEYCSATCGSRGVQQREVFCIANNTANRYFVNPELCTAEDKPEETRTCNRIPCPAHWVKGNWSQCSTSCGRGFQTRESRCPTPRGEPLFDCGAPPTDERRPCHSGRGDALCNASRDRPCRRDASKYCRLVELLGKYCIVPGFRELCCLSCHTAFNALSV